MLAISIVSICCVLLILAIGVGTRGARGAGAPPAFGVPP